MVRFVAHNKFALRRQCVRAILPVGISITSIDWEHAKSPIEADSPMCIDQLFLFRMYSVAVTL